MSNGKELTQAQQELEISSDGDIQIKNVNDLHRVSKMLLMSGMLPKAYDTPEKIMAAVTLARELGLKPLIALKNISVINGTPSIWGDLPVAMVRNSGKLESIEEFCIDKEYKKIGFENKNIDAPIFSAVCIVKRKDEEAKSFYYSALDASKNKNSTNDVWKSNFSIMMKRKARAIALKDVFGDVLNAVPIAEYDFDTIPNGPEVIKTTCEVVNEANKILKPQQ